jgi:TolA-binding protein
MAAVLAALLVGMPVRAHAVSKEIIQLQTQVQQLLDMVQRLQTTLDTRFAVLQNLAQQTADQATQMSGTVATLQKQINAQNDAISGKLDSNSGQIQSLNDSVDELKTRIAKLEKSIQDLQTQLQNIQTPPPGTMQPGSTMPAQGTGTPGAGGPGMGQNGMPGGQPGMPVTPAVNQTPPLQQTYQAALSDYNAGRAALAAGEFQDVVHYYPMDNMAGSAQFYLGEIAYRQGSFEDAIKDYNAVLEGFGGNQHAPAAQLHKGLALMKLGRRESGINELRSLIHRYPRTPEAAQAREKLNGMGVRINPK